ncbi:MAG TPA: S41 family peptidase [Kofleriaceae bacterium]|nr:S41 family peptidase [Kofleriaceae bacterium]
MHRCLLLALVAIACGTKAEPAAPPPVAPVRPDQPPPAGRAEDPAIADAVAAAVRSHEVLASMSVVPARSDVLANAAMEAAAAAIGQPPEAVAWSGDSERDRGLLKSRVAGVLGRARGALPPDLALRVARSMATAARNPHVFALDAARVGNLVAMVSGAKGAGLGFDAHAAGGEWVVSEVIAGSPAQAAGMHAGDRLISLDGRRFDEQSLLAALLVAPDQRVLVEAEMGGIHSPFRKQLQLVAAPVTRPIAESRVLEKGIGYLRIHYLPRSKDPLSDAAVNVAGALGELHKKKIGKLVIDLRDNPGGSPFDVASILVQGDPLLHSQLPGKPAEPLGRTAPSAPGFERPHRTAVLVNGQSYSAAEMVALALQEHGEARVFGQPTGRGLSFPGQAQLPGGVTLFFPEALALGPKGKVPAEQRVTPDEPVPNTTAADIDAGKDPQLAAAVAWLKKR